MDITLSTALETPKCMISTFTYKNPQIPISKLSSEKGKLIKMIHQYHKLGVLIKQDFLITL
jgi:hypothetical protein